MSASLEGTMFIVYPRAGTGTPARSPFKSATGKASSIQHTPYKQGVGAANWLDSATHVYRSFLRCIRLSALRLPHLRSPISPVVGSLPIVRDFNEWSVSLKAMLELGLAGAYCPATPALPCHPCTALPPLHHPATPATIRYEVLTWARLPRSTAAEIRGSALQTLSNLCMLGTLPAGSLRSPKPLKQQAAKLQVWLCLVS